VVVHLLILRRRLVRDGLLAEGGEIGWRGGLVVDREVLGGQGGILLDGRGLVLRLHTALHLTLDVRHGPAKELVERNGTATIPVDGLEQCSPGRLPLRIALEHGGCRRGEAELPRRHARDVDELVEALGVDNTAHAGVGVGEAAQQVEVEVLVLGAGC